eukprot:CAMPEP_0183311814 /NCGR_PEP_ID=MMETSP0160_2-20130417/39010_1 /TAXON_ID=2839 ORGANISM="Odontella Sinensis, Strain Grunow 1884" /NCGR_SAMPLE_ID=MMETSP0160_2 /ASSEMBLY_ACC=CAM_ASM_000250 /LENGTH=166 /DNA_ID=CAMNT_0025476521 /DNA_START=98 /DNA_END=595 /DNA_ORIENTATION=-
MSFDRRSTSRGDAGSAKDPFFGFSIAYGSVSQTLAGGGYVMDIDQSKNFDKTRPRAMNDNLDKTYHLKLSKKSRQVGSPTMVFDIQSAAIRAQPQPSPVIATDGHTSPFQAFGGAEAMSNMFANKPRSSYTASYHPTPMSQNLTSLMLDASAHFPGNSQNSILMLW